MKLQIPSGWYQLESNEMVREGDKFLDNDSNWKYTENDGGEQGTLTYIRQINSHFSTYKKETMKNIDITLTADEAVIIWRIFNEFGASPQRKEFEKSRAYKEGIQGTPYGYSNLEKEWDSSIADSSLLWNKINDALRKVGIVPSKYKSEPPIMVGSNEVKFENGQIKVGCTIVSNDVVKQIAAKLK